MNMKKKLWIAGGAILAMLVFVPFTYGHPDGNGDVVAPRDVIAGRAVQGQYAIYSNGKADGGDTIYQSAGFPSWSLDNSSGRMRFFRTGIVSMYLDAGGVHSNATLWAHSSLFLRNNLADGVPIVFESQGNVSHLANNKNGTFRIYRGAVEEFAITSTGNVGIGTLTPTAKLDVAGNIRASGELSASVVEIRGAGNDLAESFKVNALPGAVEPGMVVAIDPLNVGQLTLASEAYDRKVAGIISGAGDLHSGILLGSDANPAEGYHAVALTGRVWCWTDASAGAVAPGDLLTTSSTPGHAMRVNDPVKSQGAVIGKAMTALEEGKGLVLVLVTLQ